jgi:hypothetical protein
VIQIVGMAPSEREADPLEDSWGLPWGPLPYRHCAWFEMHDRSLWERRGADYLALLRDSDVPIYMQRQEPDIPMSRAYPLGPVSKLTGDYFNSSIAYMLGLAILERRDVMIYGVDNHTEDEWAYERPCNEYLIGVARGRGLKVWIHPESSLCRFSPNVKFGDEVQTYKGRYGYL